MQEDPKVARVWLLGVTRGKKHELQQGSEFQRWLNASNVHLFGDYSVLRSRFANDPAGVELWFGYQSYVPKHPELICHRVSATAFTDDLGQTYHGFLDIHGSVVGVYLPGFDHVAHRLTCNLHWMTEIAGEKPQDRAVSKPMTFTVELPRLKRVLPELGETLDKRRSKSVVSRQKGVTVEISEARLTEPKLRNLYEGQRDFLFRLKISGGKLANDNLMEFRAPLISESNGSKGLKFQFKAQTRNLTNQIQAMIQRNLQTSASKLQKPESSAGTALISREKIPQHLTIMDPYGIVLTMSDEFLYPLDSQEARKESPEKGTVWVARVVGAGRGTDVVKLHLDVRPTATPGDRNAGSPQTISFDLIVPVQTGDEI